jgi:hypothetical protein
LANTVTFQETLNWITAFLVQRPVTGVGGNANEPFLTSANKVMGTILSAPLRWEWNRVYAADSFTTTAGTSDYSVSLPTFGYLEKGVVNYVTVPAGYNPNYELEVIRNIGKDTKQNRPDSIAVLLDNNAGEITFRLFPCPDQAYDVDLIYQQAPIQATFIQSSLGFTTWAPIPDKLQFLYEQGMLAHMQMMYNQQLALSNLEVFYRSLVATAEGLSEMEKAIFLEDSLRSVKAQLNVVTGANQGKQARL